MSDGNEQTNDGESQADRVGEGRNMAEHRPAHKRSKARCMFVRCSTEQDFSGGSISVAHQFPLIDCGQFLDRRLHLAGFRLVQAGEPDEESCRWICAGVASPSAAHVLCVTHRHIPSDTSVDRSAAAQDEVDIPALRRPRSRRQCARWWVQNGTQFFGISRDCSPPLPRTFPPDDQTPFRPQHPGRS